MASNYDPLSSDLASVPLVTLQTWLFAAQQALQSLMTGTKVESVSYSQGDGAKSVSYTRADINQLRAWIAKLNAQINTLTGLTVRRGPIRAMF